MIRLDGVTHSLTLVSSVIPVAHVLRTVSSQVHAMSPLVITFEPFLVRAEGEKSPGRGNKENARGQEGHPPRVCEQERPPAAGFLFPG